MRMFLQDELAFQSTQLVKPIAWVKYATGCFLSLVIAGQTALASPSDLNADSKSDVLYRDTNGAVSAVMISGTNSVSGAAPVTVLAAGSGWTLTHTADFSADNKADLLVQHADGRVNIAVMNGAAVIQTVGVLAANTGWQATHVGDFNGDGKPDLMLLNSDGRLAVLLMNGTATSTFATLTAPGSPYRVSHVGDFNGDGKADVLLAHPDGSVTVLLMNGAVGLAAAALLSPGSPWKVVQVADLNGDAKTDIVIKHSDDSAALLLMNGTAVASAAYVLNAGSPWTMELSGDFNGDGKADLLIRHTDGSVATLLMNGTAVTSATMLLTAGTPYRVVQVADYNGDGKGDILLRGNDGSVVAVVMNGGTVISAAVLWGEGSRLVVPEPTVIAGTTNTDFPANDTEASRFLAQAAFGASPGDIARLRQIGYPAWIAEQFAMPIQYSHLTQVKRVAAGYSGQWQNRPGTWDINDSMWIGMIDSNDQLRQRTMFALSQIFVVSIKDGSVYYLGNGVASYVDMLYDKGFGNFRDLIESVTKSTAMASYLTYIYNEKEDPRIGSVPDQNYAREVMQLFTIGLWELNLDGTRKLDANGNPIPTYNNADIVGASRVLTGWTFDRATTQNWDNFYGFWNYPDNASQERPMKAFPAYHSISEKKFLGVTIPASTTSDPEGDLKKLLDRLYNHPNVGPFIGKQLIQRLVTSNPSPSYVTRVASAFNNNGAGVRGDMKAVIRAILLDPEARSASSVTNPQFGKVREPVLRMGHLMRTLKATRPTDPDSFGISEWLYDKRKGLWQTPLGSPTVFNFYRPDFRPSNSGLSQAGLVAPEMQLVNQSTVDDIQWFFRDIFENAGIASCCSEAERNTFYLKLNYSELLPLVATPDALIDRLDTLFMSGQMTPELRASIKTEMSNVTQGGSATSGLQRGVTQMKLAKALYVLLLSPEYVVQK